MYLNALGQPIIVLNSLKAASELLDRRANIYSDRPRFIVSHEILCGGLFFAFMTCGDVCVFTFLLKLRDLTPLFLVGVALAVRHMKCSQRPWFVIITQLFAKRQSSLPPRFSKVQMPWSSISGASLRLRPCLSYTIIPPSRTNMTRPLRKSIHSLIVCRQQAPLEHI